MLGGDSEVIAVWGFLDLTPSSSCSSSSWSARPRMSATFGTRHFTKYNKKCIKCVKLALRTSNENFARVSKSRNVANIWPNSNKGWSDLPNVAQNIDEKIVNFWRLPLNRWKREARPDFVSRPNPQGATPSEEPGPNAARSKRTTRTVLYMR